MSIALPPSTLLDLLNSMTVQVVGFLEYFAPYILEISLLFFCVWLIVQCILLLGEVYNVK